MSDSDNTGQTAFSDMADILADLWMNYRKDPEFEQFVEYNDLGLPLSYAVSQEVVQATDSVRPFVEETFGILLDALGIEDEGFNTLDDVLDRAAENN